VAFDGCSERGLGFSGYNDDENESVAMATSTNSARPTADGRVTSDINRNRRETAQYSAVGNNSTAQPSSKHVDTKARERRDENNVDERRDTLVTLPQVSNDKSYLLPEILLRSEL